VRATQSPLAAASCADGRRAGLRAKQASMAVEAAAPPRLQRQRLPERRRRSRAPRQGLKGRAPGLAAFTTRAAAAQRQQHSARGRA
jgi:hypothetical protein